MLKDVLAYQRAMPPANAVTVTVTVTVTVKEMAGTLQVTPARVRAMARTEWPADGRDAGGRLWWNRGRLDELLGRRRRRAFEYASPGLFELFTAALQIEPSSYARRSRPMLLEHCWGRGCCLPRGFLASNFGVMGSSPFTSTTLKPFLTC